MAPRVVTDRSSLPVLVDRRRRRPLAPLDQLAIIPEEEI
jgi:hypothetical protein